MQVVKDERFHRGRTPASVTIVAICYRARCTESACANLGRLILRYADASGQPIICSATNWPSEDQSVVIRSARASASAASDARYGVTIGYAAVQIDRWKRRKGDESPTLT
jgi:hypothetical protein